MTTKKIRKIKIDIINQIKVLIEQRNMDEALSLLDYIDQVGEELFDDEIIDGKCFKQWYILLDLLAEGSIE